MQHVIRNFFNKIKKNHVSPRRKIFCIGRNKTGTTSMAEFLSRNGYTVAPQTPAELMIDDWHAGHFEPIISFARTEGDAFQDIPFSLPGTYIALHQVFPDSRFILTIRDSAEDWYRSLTTFHAKLFGNGQIPRKEDLMRAEYNGKGWMWKVNRMVYNTPDNDIYNREMLIAHYNKYNQDVMDYFSKYPGSLLMVNLSEPDAADRIGRFLELKLPVGEMPWENKT